MKIIYNKLIPFKGFSAIMFFGSIFARAESKPISARTINHEAIHKAQAKDCGGYIPYYLLYLWLSVKYGYRNNPMEREAYGNESDFDYVKNRLPSAWRQYK